MSIPACEAISQYHEEMTEALSTVAVDEKDAAPRDASMFAARRIFAASVPVPLSSEMISELDRALGLPPIDPSLGLPNNADAEWLDLRCVLLRNPSLTPENVDF
jgi:hypothetical protein